MYRMHTHTHTHTHTHSVGMRGGRWTWAKETSCNCRRKDKCDRNFQQLQKMWQEVDFEIALVCAQVFPGADHVRHVVPSVPPSWTAWLSHRVPEETAQRMKSSCENWACVLLLPMMLICWWCVISLSTSSAFQLHSIVSGEKETYIAGPFFVSFKKIFFFNIGQNTQEVATEPLFDRTC